MCRSIRPLFNFDPPATPKEIEEASLQFVRKISGTRHPSRANQEAFDQAVRDITAVAGALLESLVTRAPARARPLATRPRDA